ncbi:MAG: HAMP domain-containing histidine kinase [Planctomycetes bacterium]|nr:HAMP domain-containing histidine kinase [Planctomycetota bacterium]
MAGQTTDSVALDVLQANVELLAEKERLEGERIRLLELDRLKTEFLGRVSHDLRTPLNSIIGFSDLIIAGVGGKMNRKHAEFIAAINRNGHALLALINDLLDLSSIDARKMALKRAHVPLQTILEDLRAATEPVLTSANLTVAWPDTVGMIGKGAYVDRRRLSQVLVNLVDNARKFTPPGGRVSISMDADADAAVFTVRDSGQGIPPEERERIFHPYYQRSQSTLGSRVDGIGLGLVIVKAIVDLHQGRIVLDGEAGKGCMFQVVLPQKEGELASAHASAHGAVP